MHTTVSIILPVRDSGAYLKRCIDSVISQRSDDWELIVINDGSEDDTCDIVRSYADNDHRISLYDSPGKGVSDARNHGLDIACGRYVCFLDSDDDLDPEFLSELIKTAEDEASDITQCSFYYSYDDGRSVPNGEAVSARYSSHDDIMRAYFDGMIGQINLACWGKLYRSDLIKDIRFDNTLTIQEDAYFTFECCMKAAKAVCIDKPLYHYYQNPGSVMNRVFDGSKMQYFTVLDRELDICGSDEELGMLIMKRKMITAMDLSSDIIRDDSGKEYLGGLRDIALSTSDKISKKVKLGTKIRFKLFLLRHFPSMYYGLIRSKHK